MFATGIGSSWCEGVRSQGRQLLVERNQIPVRSQVWTALHQQGLSRGALINPSSFLQAELGKAAVAFWETIGKLDERCMAWGRERLKWGPSGPNREPKLCEEEELFSCNRRVLLEPELGSDHGRNEERHQDKLLPLNAAFHLTFHAGHLLDGAMRMKMRMRMCKAG